MVPVIYTTFWCSKYWVDILLDIFGSLANLLYHLVNPVALLGICNAKLYAVFSMRSYGSNESFKPGKANFRKIEHSSFRPVFFRHKAERKFNLVDCVGNIGN